MKPLPALAIAGPLPEGLEPTGFRLVAGTEDHQAVLVLTGLAERAQVVEAGLSAGKTVLCPFPPCTDPVALQRLHSATQRGGRLVTYSGIAGSAAGARALQATQDGRLGRLFSMWVGVRLARGGDGGGLLDRYLWDVLDFAVATHEGRLERVQAHCAAVFSVGPEPDTAEILLRLAPEFIITAEIARCLPPSIPVPDEGEIEIEIIGAQQTLRLEPNAGHVRVYADGFASARPWFDTPLTRAIAHAAAALETGEPDPGALTRTARAIEIMEAVKAQTGRAPPG